MGFSLKKLPWKRILDGAKLVAGMWNPLLGAAIDQAEEFGAGLKQDGPKSLISEAKLKEARDTFLAGLAAAESVTKKDLLDDAEVTGATDELIRIGVTQKEVMAQVVEAVRRLKAAKVDAPAEG